MLIALKTTKDNERGPLAMTRVLRALHRASNGRELIWFLFASHQGRTGLYIDFSNTLWAIVEKQFQGEYPGLDLEELDEATLKIDPKHAVWWTELRLRPDLFPIMRFSQQEEGSRREFSDPLTGILEALAPADHNLVHASVELVVRPAGRLRCWSARRAVQRLALSEFHGCPEKSRRYAIGITHTRWCVRLLTWIWGFRFCPQEKRPAITADLVTSGTRTHEREDAVQAAHQKVSGCLFEAHLRIVVSGPKHLRASDPETKRTDRRDCGYRYSANGQFSTQSNPTGDCSP